jgi:hypothetical protein
VAGYYQYELIVEILKDEIIVVAPAKTPVAKCVALSHKRSVDQIALLQYLLLFFLPLTTLRCPQFLVLASTAELLIP